VASGKLLESAEHRDQPAKQKAQAVAHDHDVGVIGHVGARGAEMQVGPG
jgi:hypothetical protein